MKEQMGLLLLILAALLKGKNRKKQQPR